MLLSFMNSKVWTKASRNVQEGKALFSLMFYRERSCFLLKPTRNVSHRNRLFSLMFHRERSCFLLKPTHNVLRRKRLFSLMFQKERRYVSKGKALCFRVKNVIFIDVSERKTLFSLMFQRERRYFYWCFREKDVIFIDVSERKRLFLLRSNNRSSAFLFHQSWRKTIIVFPDFLFLLNQEKNHGMIN